MRGRALAAALGVVTALCLPGVAVAAGPGPDRAGSSASAGTSGPVEGTVRRLALEPRSATEAAVSAQNTDRFGLMGVSWKDASAEVQGKIEARSRNAVTGAWTPWVELEPLKAGLDGVRPGARGATEPVWVGSADGAEVRVSGGSAALPAGLELDLVDPGKAGRSGAAKSAPASGARAAAAAVTPGPESTAPRPDVVPRAQWGADESLNNEGPIYLAGGKIKALFVHHTAAAAPYECTDSAAIVRGLHVYHVKTNGWRDLGYNFLVDKCGTLFEGRQGGVDQPVMGAHTYGFNSESTSVAVLGDHTTAGASPEALEGISKMAAYKLGQYDADMDGTTTLTAGATQKNYAGTSFTAGQPYQFKTVSGHRDGFNTECPGHQLYPQLDTIRKSGPAARLKIGAVNEKAVVPGGTAKTPGPLVVDFSTSTAAPLVSSFELLVDGTSVATVGGDATRAATMLSLGGHRVQVRATAKNGKVSTSLPVTVEADVSDVKYVPVLPKRLMDTREGVGVPKAKVGPGEVAILKVAGVQGIPAYGVTSVALNVTATNPTEAGHVSVYPNGVARPSTSNLNFTAGQTIPNLVVVPVQDGIVQFYNSAGTVDLIADINGYFLASGEGSTHMNLGPKRILDTRDGTGGAPVAPVGQGQVLDLQVSGLTGVEGVPVEGVTAVVLNVTATNPSTAGHVSVYPHGTTRTSASNLNFTTGQTIPNLVIVPVVDGKISFYNNAGTVDLIADITGYFTTSGQGAKHSGAGPKRLMDTRSGLGVAKAPVGAGGVVTLTVAGVEGVPAEGVTAVVLNVTATNPSTAGHVSVYPHGTTRTSASNLNFTTGQTIPNLVIVPVVDGKISFYNNAGTVDLIADITGYFSK
ncbi:N-acetylmuramoyl-L-alanine amidase [Streptomyces erythrochromogenes]|uniref:N-acetylmuramoyl-L-alanine amidase n=1 Tax=Streptomyces erythrochromogenes TaxID=285574 RepID=UPI0022554C63|nr:N-acetylmuramoyl-L-alanine amidase [Streptomyces erythrochromogenes]MCX5587041.1 N-acetylmuramoyl-L-alanine amidase [Streptomyces erythrochromogenes]